MYFGISITQPTNMSLIPHSTNKDVLVSNEVLFIGTGTRPRFARATSEIALPEVQCSTTGHTHRRSMAEVNPTLTRFFTDELQVYA